MLHGENIVEEEDELVVRRRSRVGLILLSVYATGYFLFIVGCSFFSSWIAKTEVAGLPLSIFYGFLLMAGAMVIASVYGWLCKND